MLLRSVFFVMMSLCFIAFVPSDVFAQNVQQTKSSSVDNIKRAQEQLRFLGFYTGNIDGIAGQFTQNAVRNFQRSYGLPVTGKLDSAAMVSIDAVYLSSTVPPSVMVVENERSMDDIIAEMAMQASMPQKEVGARLRTRFGIVELVKLEGLYYIELNQSAISDKSDLPLVTHSSVAAVGNTDAFLVTRYNVKNDYCKYQHSLFVLNNNGYNELPIDNCTRTNNLKMHDGSLIITFPESNRAADATWRFDGVLLYKL